MATITDLEKEIENIKQRNIKVEEDKAWETSLTRKIIISILTYVVISLFFLVAGFSNPWFNSIVPTTGFILSTLSLSYFKNFWLKHTYKK